MNIDTKKIANNLINSIEKEKIFLNPVENHPIENQEEDIKDMYFIMLNVLGNINDVLNKAQNLFLQRLLTTGNLKDNIDDYLHKANNIDEDFIKKLVNTIGDIDLKYNLILDMLILLALADESKDGQIKLISETALILRLSLNDILNLTSIAKSIIEQDKRTILDFIDEEDNLLEHFITYIENYYSGLISYNKKLIYGIAEEDSKISFKTLLDKDNANDDKFISIQMAFEKELESRGKTTKHLNSESIIFKNYFMYEDNLQLSIDNCKIIIFEHCDFENNFATPLLIKNSDSVMFKNCMFKNMDNISVILESVDKVYFESCRFINCKNSKTISSIDVDDFKIINSTFEKISFKSLTDGIFTFDVCPSIFVVENNNFKKCKNTSGYGALVFATNKAPFDDYIIKVDNNNFEKCFSHTIGKGDALKDSYFNNNKFDNEINLF